MPILREWRAEIRRTNSEDCVSYIRSTGLADYRKTPGNLSALIAVREVDMERVEVITMSLWESWEAIREFAGDPPDRARYYPKDDEYLLTRPEKVKHYEAYGELMQVGGTAA